MKQQILVACIFVIFGTKLLNAQPNLFEDYNIIWTAQSKNSSESMPLGGGDIGCNVWVEGGDVLVYVQRSGSIAETHEYLKLGRIRLHLEPNPFVEGDFFHQELKLNDGYIEIIGKSGSQSEALEVKLSLWVDVFKPVVHFEVAANKDITVDAAYEHWRNEDQVIPNNTQRGSSYTLDRYPGEVVLAKDSVRQDENSIVFFHRNPDDKLVTDILLKQQGLEAYKADIPDDLKGRTFGGALLADNFKPAPQTEGVYQGMPFTAKHITSKQPKKNHHIRLVTHIAQTNTLQEWEAGLASTVSGVLDEKAKKVRQNTRTWWNEYWKRSYIRINSGSPSGEDSAWVAARNYQLFRYQLGCNAFGEYPTKFNGGNFTVDAGLIDDKRAYGPDFRAWGGGVFTAQNQRLVYWPMLKSGDHDAILSQFELYRKALPGSLARVKKHFGHNGAMYSEYISVPGLAVGSGYGWSEGVRNRGTEVPFGDDRADGTKGYGSVVEKGIMANGYVSYHWESQLEHAYMILEYHRYFGTDISKYMPFIENALIFFDEHYRMREKLRGGQELNSSGKLVIFPSTSCESYRGAKNPSDVVAGLQACLTALLALDDELISIRDKNYYKSFLQRLPGYFYDQVSGDTILKPAESWKLYQNVECPQFYPLFPFNRFGLGEDDMTVFRNTWKHGTFPKGMVISWHQDGIFFARMGMTQEAAAYNTKKLANSNRRFPTFWGPGHDWVPDHNWGGSGMIGLQEMLMQCFDDKILLFPAWPQDWDVDFKLHAPKNTTVEGKLKGGKLVELQVSPESRRSDVSVMGIGFERP